MKIKTGEFTDPSDGRVYKTVKLGNQEWMVENLNVSNYRNGDPIPEIRDDDKWGERSVPDVVTTMKMRTKKNLVNYITGTQ